MNNENYRTSLYVSSTQKRLPTKKEVRDCLSSKVKNFVEDNKLDFLEEKQLISYNDIQISFLVNDAPLDQLYIVSFQPTGVRRSSWGNERTLTQLLVHWSSVIYLGRNSIYQSAT